MAAGWRTLLGLQVDEGKAVKLAKASAREEDLEFCHGNLPSEHPFGANFVDSSGAGPLNPTLYWFATAEELVAFLAGAACTVLGEEEEGSPARRAKELCQLIKTAKLLEDVLKIGSWYEHSDLTWVGTLDDLYHGKSETSEEARFHFEDALEDDGEEVPEEEALRKQRFIQWLDDRSEDEETGFS